MIMNTFDDAAKWTKNAGHKNGWYIYMYYSLLNCQNWKLITLIFMYFTTRTAACTERNRDKNDRLMMWL